MQTYPMSLSDYSFFSCETQESPKHVGTLAIFRKPEAVEDDYLEKLVADWLSYVKVSPPFNLKLHRPLLGAPCWKTDARFNAKNHCFYHKLTQDGGRSELYQRVCELHKDVLDHSRPCWEIHVFDGLKDRRLGLYFRMHHAYGDGQTMTAWASSMFSTEPSRRDVSPLWSNPVDYGNQDSNNPQVARQLEKLLAAGKGLSGSVYGLARISSQLWVEALGLTKNAIAIPFTAKQSRLTGQVPAGRDFASAAISMKTVGLLRKLTRSTLNHVALTCIDMAMDRYLNEIGSPLDGPLTICMPVSLRPEDAKKGGGNSVGMVPVNLSAKTDDPLIRLREIGVALQGVREQINNSPASSIKAYSLLTLGIPQLGEMMNFSDSLPPVAHAIVSNVPGPKTPLYLAGSKMEESYPVSALGCGMYLNITIFSYNGMLYFGLLAAKDMLPDLNRLGAYIHQAFIELEGIVTSPDMGIEQLERIRTERQSCAEAEES